MTDETVEPPKKRGRPTKAAAVEEEEEEAVEPPRKRGRPANSTVATSQPVAKKAGRPAKATVAEPPKKRGRPAQVRTEPVDAATTEAPKKRGRPSTKQAAPALAKQVATTQPAKRGGPWKATTDPAQAPADPDTPAPRKRHSGRTGGPTTKISTDAADAADQLEEELVDQVEKSAKKGGKSKSSSSDSGKNYWLMKAEQVDRMETLKDGSDFNTKFTIDDLKAKSAPEPWEGVRNMVARNNMRAMKKGDLAFFYASQGKAPGITGIIEIVKEHEPDFTVTDESSIGYVEPAKRGKENQWSVVHVEFRKKLSEPVTLKQLQKFSGSNAVLSDMQVLKQSRLSVAKVSEREWDFIVDNLIEGYEEEDTDDHHDTDMDDDDGLAGVNVGGDPPLNPNSIGGQAIAGAYVDELEGLSLDLPNVPVVNGPDGFDELPTSGTALPPTTHATSRPTSRAGSYKAVSRQGSRPASRAGSNMPASRQGSLAAPAFQTKEVFAEVTTTENTFQDLEPGIPEPTGLSLLEKTVKQGVSSRASSRAPSRAPSRASSRAPSLQQFVRAASLEPSARPGSRGTMGMIPSLIESPVDA
jgi:predicted RNA-binding protein with PUA-like domain